MRKIKAEDVIVSKSTLFFPFTQNITLIEELDGIKKDLRELERDNIGNLSMRGLDRSLLHDRIDTLKKSIDLILQELKLNPDEWEYKTETKLVKKTSMTASEAVKAGKK